MPSERPRGELLAQLASLGVAAEVVSAWASEPPDPAPGQVWRAEWDGVVQVVLVFDAGERVVTAAPVTFETGEPGTYTVPSEATDFGSAFGVWLDLVREIPERALSQFGGNVDAASNTDAAQFRSYVEQISQRELPLVSAAQPGYLDRAEVDDVLDTLVASASEVGGDGTLPRRLNAVGLDELGSFVGGIPRAMALKRGQAALTEQEAQALAEHLVVTAGELLSANPSPPAELLARLERPRWRSNVRRLASKRAIPEARAWSTAAYEVWAAAARATGSAAEDPWDQKIGRYFEAVLGG